MNTNLSVVTVTLNPALDLTGSLAELKLGQVNLVKQATLHPAGKGVNVAKVLAELGAQVTVTGFLGKENDAPFADLFLRSGIEDAFIRVPGATRINVKLVEQDGQVSDVNFPGVQIDDAAFAALVAKLIKLADSHRIFVISGSLPQGVSPSQCGSLVARLNQLGCKVFFDSSQQALAQGIQAQPFLVKPNETELRELTQLPLIDIASLSEAGQALQQQGCRNVVVSLGEQGLLWFDEQGCLAALPPKVELVSTVGAGDTLVAGLCWGELNAWPKSQTLSFSTALAALAVSQVGVGIDDLSQLMPLLEQVKLVDPMDLVIEG
ncbi:1-phosphofructokinase [Motilimonas cestriensis]|uniref:1-phosphofructokinase n=1 Tax=Motilimonas cestriensis TaxID=2742685 RepID=UPI003DA451E0